MDDNIRYFFITYTNYGITEENESANCKKGEKNSDKTQERADISLNNLGLSSNEVLPKRENFQELCLQYRKKYDKIAML